MTGFSSFLKVTRAKMSCTGNACRIVYESAVAENSGGILLSQYVADRAPLFYRDPANIFAELKDGYFLSAVRSTLAKMPTVNTFQESHFGEITAGIFAQEALGLVLLYSKLALLSAENANAFKMDLVLCDPSKDPIEFVFGEVKTSTKDQVPANHDKSVFADLFNSIREYEETDKEFDLTAARDRLTPLSEPLQTRIRTALKPYSDSPVRYAGFVVIDRGTHDPEESNVLHTRKSKKAFDVDLICVESLAKSGEAAYKILEEVRKACSQSKN